MEDESDDAERTRPPVMGDLVDAEKDAWDREYLRKLLIDRGEWPVE